MNSCNACVGDDSARVAGQRLFRVVSLWEVTFFRGSIIGVKGEFVGQRD